MVFLVMGVAGSGKSTIGSLLAERLALPFYDADTFHLPESRAKLERNEPLDDDDRARWLARLAEDVPRWEALGGAVLACSALKAAYRSVLFGRLDTGRSRVIFLDVERNVIRARLEDRKGRHALVHEYDRIVTGQFRDLEPPRDAIVVSGPLSPEDTVEEVLRVLASEGRVSPGAVRVRGS